jgi:hypothetical protein
MIKLLVWDGSRVSSIYSFFHVLFYTDFLFNMQGVFSEGFMTTGDGFDAGLSLTLAGEGGGLGLDIRVPRGGVRGPLR